MLQLLHISTAVTLLSLQGMISYSPYWKEFASPAIVLEDGPSEDSDVVSRLEPEKHKVFWDLQPALGFACPGLRMPPLADYSQSVERDCVEMQGCRPPPVTDRC